MDCGIDYVKLSSNAMKASLYMMSKGCSDSSLVISFFTDYKGVVLPEYVRSSFPKNITIILQYQFSDLLVFDNFFSVILTFKGKEEKIIVPLNSIYFFVLNVLENKKDIFDSKTTAITSRKDNVLFVDKFKNE